MWTCCKRRRLSIIKRWTDHEGFHEILKCRYCDWHERRDIPLKVADGSELTATRRTITDKTAQSGTEPAKPQDDGPRIFDKP